MNLLNLLNRFISLPLLEGPRGVLAYITLGLKKEAAEMSSESYKQIDVNVPWVFIPLSLDDAHRVYLWIKRCYPVPEADKALASDCEKAIESALDALGLKYNKDAFGEVKMDNLRLYSGSDGIAMPETCFVVAPPEVKRIRSPLKPLQDE